MKQRFRRMTAFLLTVMMFLTSGAVPTLAAEEQKSPPDSFTVASNYGYDFKFTFSDQTDWLNAITGVSVAGEAYNKVDSSYGVWGDTDYYVDAASSYVLIGEGGTFTENKAECVISAEGYPDLTLELDKSTHTATIIANLDVSECEHSGGTATCLEQAICEKCGQTYGELGEHNYVNGKCSVCGDELEAAVFTGSTRDGSEVSLTFDKDDFVSTITGISIQEPSGEEITCTEAGSKFGLYNKTNYYRDTANNALYFTTASWSSGVTEFQSGSIITISSSKYKPVTLKLSVTDSGLSFQEVDAGTEAGDEYALHVRLVGSFESALVNQSGYDAVSGASTGVTQNKNSNVEVQAVILPKEQEPTDDDWKLLKDSGVEVDTSKDKTYVSLDSASGMVGVYSAYDSSLTLSGTPKTEGTYSVSITVTDKNGRTATSNELTFRVYNGEEYLQDCLTLANCTQTADGKYMYDMEPWAIKNFDQDDNTVTVPADIKAWYGSHTSGTYGKLGYAVSEGSETTQTLLVPSGCNLTLVNMDVLSSVRIVVQNGGTLVLRDSVVQGVVEVQDGGTFSMNYNDFGDDGEFLTGASINGQLILQDGSILENAKIYSNTNNIANGDEARHNTKPVVVANGNVTVKGQVFIRGDEAPTGTDEATGKSYAGQSGLQVNGTLTVEKDAVLAVYGGGKNVTTSVGGTAVILNNGTITGEGTLIAVGGNGFFDDGGNATTGSGTISVKNAYLQGGDTVKPKDGAVAGTALADGITLSNNTNRNLIDGETINDTSYNGNPNYWSDITTVPDIKDYTVEENAPGEDTPDPKPDPDPDPLPKPDPLPDPNPTTPSVHKHDATLKTVAAKAATCMEAGNTAYYICDSCGAWFEDAKAAKEIKNHDSVVIPAVGHTSSVTVTKATEKADGKISERVCKTCGLKLEDEQTIARPTMKLSRNSYTYSKGKTRKPSVTVTDRNGKAIDSDQYTVRYDTGRRKVGVYTVTVTFRDDCARYEGELSRSFVIHPRTTAIKSLTAKKNGKLTVKWNKRILQTSGYQIQYSTSKSFAAATTKTVRITNKTTTSKTLSKLKTNKKYYVRVRAYKIANGTRIYSAWSATKSVWTKK